MAGLGFSILPLYDPHTLGSPRTLVPVVVPDDVTGPMQMYPNPAGDPPLLIRDLLARVVDWAPDQTIVYRDQVEITYTAFHRRVHRLANVLRDLGVKSGDRVGVMDWDSHRYLELFFAIPMIGAVLHTVNIRLSPDQTAFTIAHAGDSVLFVHTDFLELLSSVRSHVPEVRTLVLLAEDGAGEGAPGDFAGEYEALLAGASPIFDFPDFDERSVATLFYTTGTTGEPKGVFFTHRQIVLHTLGTGIGVSAFGEKIALLKAGDVYMPLTPMFHVHAWGIPYLATALGLKQVYPGRFEPTVLVDLLVRHKVSFSHSVPTVLQMLLHHPAASKVDLKGLKLCIGGAALAKGLAREAMARGIVVMGGYGMSETCPIIALSQVKPGTQDLQSDQALDYLTRTGFPLPLVRVGIMDPEGNLLPPGAQNTGELVLRAPWLTTGYFKDEARSAELWRHGWLHTGDVAYLDPEGYIRITDRLKDVIKIGGEWISSLELESALSQHEAVKEAAVVGLPDDRWGERPHAEVVLREEWTGRVTPRELATFLHRFIDEGHIHKRAILTQIALCTFLPRTSVGKIDKKAIRARLEAQPPSKPHGSVHP